MGGTRGPITTFIVEPFVPHKDEYYLSIVSDRLGVDISFSECGGIDIEENWDKVWRILHPPYSSHYTQNWKIRIGLCLTAIFSPSHREDVLL